MSIASEVVKIARSQVGVRESPMGSNRGARIQEYQASTTLGGTGWPWCAAFVCWTWREAGVENAKGQASASTYWQCAYAKSRGLQVPATPGAAIVWCSQHVGLLIEPAGGGLWRTIEGNSGDQVTWRTRSLAGALIYVPTGWTGEPAGEAVPRDRDYLAEDVALRGVREWGGFADKDQRDRAVHALVTRGIPRPELRTFRRDWPSPAAPFYVERPSKGPRWYGPWDDKAPRDAAIKSLEDKLGRQLRPAAFLRAGAGGGKVMTDRAGEPMGKTT